MPEVLHLHPMPAWEIPGEIAIYGVGPSRPVAPGELFHVALFANSKDQHVEAFQLRFNYDSSVAGVESVAVNPMFRYLSVSTCSALQRR